MRRPVGRPANWVLREKIFRAIARSGAVQFRTAPRIAKLLRLTKAVDDEMVIDVVTVNNHLRRLEECGLIAQVGEENRAGRGRPSKVFSLTPLGEVAATFR